MICWPTLKCATWNLNVRFLKECHSLKSSNLKKASNAQKILCHLSEWDSYSCSKCPLQVGRGLCACCLLLTDSPSPTGEDKAAGPTEQLGLRDDLPVSCHQPSLSMQRLEGMGPWSRKQPQGICGTPSSLEQDLFPAHPPQGPRLRLCDYPNSTGQRDGP